MTDPFVGQLTFVRVSGVLSKGDTVYNPVRAEGAYRPYRADARQQPRRSGRNRAGDIAACVGLKDVTTGETLCDPDAVIIAGAHGVP